MDIAVAYASVRGLRHLKRAMEDNPHWEDATRRALVSIDFGITQPAALELLASFPNTEVRVPNAASVLASPLLIPATTFHAKAFHFYNESDANAAMVTGSANLTLSALATGGEVVTLHSNAGGDVTPPAKAFTRFQSWFDQAWALSTEVAEVLEDYAPRYKSRPRPRKPPEERTARARQYAKDARRHEVFGAVDIQLAEAKTLWTEVWGVTQNRGQLPGNQIDLQRGARVFFGFPSDRVGKNHHFGDVVIRIPGFAPTRRGVRFGNNDMDKLNLPKPEENGIDSYDQSILAFERDGHDPDGTAIFTLRVLDRAALNSMIQQAEHSVSMKMGSGREWGLLF
ncbi:hypothetical protein ACIQLJ_08920 [Microbacterium sp. NPDC091313]